MERTIRRLAFSWIALVGGVLLVQRLAFPSSARLAYWLLVVVACGCPLMVLLLLALVGLRLRELWQRVRVLRRAARWKRPKTSQGWMEPE